MCTPNTVIYMSRTIGALRLGLYAPDTQVIPVAPIYYCNFDIWTHLFLKVVQARCAVAQAAEPLGHDFTMRRAYIYFLSPISHWNWTA